MSKHISNREATRVHSNAIIAESILRGTQPEFSVLVAGKTERQTILFVRQHLTRGQKLSEQGIGIDNKEPRDYSDAINFVNRELKKIKRK